MNQRRSLPACLCEAARTIALRSSGLAEGTDCESGSRMRSKRGEVIGVARDDNRTNSGGDDSDVSIHHVRSGGPRKKCSDRVRLAGFEAHDVAATQEPTQLCLPWRTARLRDHRRGGDRDETGFEAGAVIGPHAAIAAVGSDQDTGVVDGRHADRLRFDPSSSATRCRADASSSGVNDP